MQVVDLNGNRRECEQISIDQKYPGYVTVKFISKNRVGHHHIEWYPIADFSKHNPQLAAKLGNPSPPPKSDLGVVTHSGEYYLEDTTKEWENNIFVGYLVWISRGPGEGQVRLIKSNTRNNLTIDTAWDVLPSDKSQYVISRDIHDVKILNNQLPENFV